MSPKVNPRKYVSLHTSGIVPLSMVIANASHTGATRLNSNGITVEIIRVQGDKTSSTLNFLGKIVSSMRLSLCFLLETGYLTKSGRIGVSGKHDKYINFQSERVGRSAWDIFWERISNYLSCYPFRL